MISTTDPESMTAEERRREVANILANGFLRRLHTADTAESPPGKTAAETPRNRLELPSKARLSVAPRPVG